MIELKNITMVLSHPDDEVIFGWLVLKQATKIITVVGSSKYDNTHPKWRDMVLEEMGKFLGIEVICLHYEDCICRLSQNEIDELFEKLKEVTKDSEIIFTHNEHGDYGHPDHKLVYQLVSKLNKKVIVSNITDFGKDKTNFTPVKITGKELQVCYNDLDFYEKCHKIYDKNACWTWGHPPIKEAILMEKSSTSMEN